MKNLRQVVEMIIRHLKSNENYSLDGSISACILARVLSRRFSSALRGMVSRWRFKSVSGLLFIGKNVSFYNTKFIEFGRSVTIKDNVVIDGLSKGGIKIGNNVTICRNVIIENTGVLSELGERLTVGDNSSIGDFSFIATRGPITIGKNVLISPRVSFHAENHNYSEANIPIRLQGVTRKGIIVEDDCWIGAGCIILDGVTVGRGAVIAAGSVINRNVPSFTVMAGVPARAVKKRG